ncbi:MAG: hypothetical protein QM689_07160 [Oscillospiraceae bacterium]
MPQINKGGKFVFGKSLIRDGFLIHLPPQAVTEYTIAAEKKIYLFTGSKSTGGFCVTRKGLLYPSKIGNILKDTPALLNYELSEGEFVPYKGRFYCWINISPDGIIVLPAETAAFLQIKIGMELLSIRGSNIAFVMGAKGPLLEEAEHYNGVIDVF